MLSAFLSLVFLRGITMDAVLFFGIVGLWVFFFGAAFGSFLNVAVWRLPKKMALSFPASHCPKCGHAIRKRHNVPVLGWLMLRGKCFDCRSPIAFRYPLVEFLCGTAFLVQTFPFWLEENFYSSYFGWMASAADCVFFLTAFGAGWILWDRNRIPFRFFVPALLCWSWLLWELVKIPNFVQTHALLCGAIGLLPVIFFFFTRIPKDAQRFFAVFLFLVSFLWAVKIQIVLFIVHLYHPML